MITEVQQETTDVVDWEAAYWVAERYIAALRDKMNANAVHTPLPLSQYAEICEEMTNAGKDLTNVRMTIQPDKDGYIVVPSR